MNNKKIDWTDFRVLHTYSKNQVFFGDDYKKHNRISSKEFLEWAKIELENCNKDIETRMLFNIITNVKRAIDSKCESILYMFGYKENINAKNYPEIKEYLNGEGAVIINLISNLTGLNVIIVDEVRRLRNTIEHDYISPSLEDAKRAVSVAELFTMAIDSIINNISYSIEISSRKFEDSITIQLFKSIDNNDEFTFIYVDDEKFNPKQKEYFELLNILITGYYSKCPKLFGYDCDIRHIKYKEYYNEDDIFFEEDRNI